MVSRLGPWLLVAAVGAAILLPMAGSFGFWDPLEPLYARSAVEMSEGGSWLMPSYLNRVRLAKPILAYWGILGGWAVFGVNEFGARLPGILLAIVGMLATYHVAAALRGPRAGLLSALVLGTMPQYYLLARQATPDIYLAVSFGIALAFFGLGVYGDAAGRRSSLTIAAVATALALLAKGPFVVGALVVGTLGIHLLLHLDLQRLTAVDMRVETLRFVSFAAISLGAAAFAGWRLLTFADPVRETVGAGSIVAMTLMVVFGALWFGVALRRYVTRPALWPAVRPVAEIARENLPRCAGLLLAIAAPWFIWAAVREPTAFFSDFVFFNNVQRFFREIENSGNATYYLRTLLFGAYPWSIFIPAVFALAVPWRAPRPLERHGADVLWLVSILVTFGIFTLSVTKFPHYIAPALIPLALSLGGTLDRMLESPTSQATRLALLVAAMSLLPPSADLMREQGLEYLLESFTINDSLSSDVTSGPLFTGLIGLLLLLLLASVVVGARPLVWGFVACAFGFAAWANWSFIPAVSPGKTVERVCAAWIERAGPADELGVYKIDDAPGVHYYTGGRTHLLGSNARLYDYLAPGRTTYAIVPEDRLSSLTKGFAKRFPGNKLYLIDDSHRDYTLITAIRPLLTREAADP